MPPLPTRASAGDHAAWLLVQVVLAAAAFAIAGRGFVATAPAYGALALVSTGILLASVLGAVLAIPVCVARRDPVTFLLAPAVLASLTFFAYADGVIYRIFRIHVNGMVVNLLATPGGGDSFTLGGGTWVSSASIAAIVWGLHLTVGWMVLGKIARTHAPTARRLARPAVLGMLAIVLLDKTTFAWASFAGRADLMRVRSLIPLYRPVSLNKFLAKGLGLHPVDSGSVALSATGSELAYPRAPLSFRPDAKRLNVAIVAVEGLRSDLLDVHVMPNVARWAAGELYATNNLSGGNASRFGVFSLLYGLDGTLWRSFREEARPPLLISALRERGYAFRILSGTDLHYPEFRQIVFRDIADTITDSWPGERYERDRLQTEAIESFLDKAPSPFFIFSFYDASHQPYLYPPEDEIFVPTLPPDQLDYVRIAAGHSEQLPLLFNRYTNALHYADREIGRLLESLSRRNLMDDTIVVVCGDHGEEFGESGFVGHNSAFDRWQLETPLVVHVPGVGPRRIERPTAHEDVVPTIFEALGVTNPPSDYSHGTPLTAASGPDRFVVASWDEAAVVGPDETAVFGTEATNLGFHVIDRDGKPLPGREAAHRGDLAEVLKRMGMFRR